MKVGDRVESLDPIGNPLRSGAEYYDHATVASVAPFILVSDDGDMMWSVTRKPDDVRVVGDAPPKAVQAAKERLARETARQALTEDSA